MIGAVLLILGKLFLQRLGRTECVDFAIEK